MDTNINVIEAHLASGKTLPLRTATAKSGNVFWGVLAKKASGERYFNRYGVNVAESVTGHPATIKEIKVEGVGTVKVKHDTNEKGKARASATKTFTSPVDHEKWTLDFRATLMSDGIVNLSCSIHRTGGTIRKANVLTEL
jgi:hypothetical protein